MKQTEHKATLADEVKTHNITLTSGEVLEMPTNMDDKAKSDFFFRNSISATPRMDGKYTRYPGGSTRGV